MNPMIPTDEEIGDLPPNLVAQMSIDVQARWIMLKRAKRREGLGGESRGDQQQNGQPGCPCDSATERKSAPFPYCANWKDGRCEMCGAQHQGMEVSGDFKCPHFVRR